MLHLWKKNLKKLTKSKNYWKFRDYCHYTGKYRGAEHSICNLRFNVPNEIPVVFHNGSNYDSHFTIKELANEYKGQFEFLGGKYRKVQNFFCSNRKGSYKKLIKKEMKMLQLYLTKQNLLIVKDLW